MYGLTERYQDSIKYANKSIVLDIKLYGKYNVNTAHSYHNIAGTYYNFGQLDEAQKAYEEAIDIKTNLFGKDHYETCISLAGLGNVYRCKEEYDKAIECHTLYYNAYKSIFGDKDLYLAVIMSGIGTDYYEKGDYKTALAYHKRAVEILQEQNESIASSYYNCIGNDLYGMGNYKEAIEAYEVGLKCRDIEEISNNRLVLVNCIIKSYQRAYNHHKALEYSLKALDIRIKLNGENSEDVISGYYVVGSIYRALGDFKNSVKYRAKELEWHLRNSGKKSEETATAYNNVGAQYRDLGDYDKALEYIGKAYEISKETGRTEYEAVHLNRLGRVYALMGDVESAKAKFEEAISLLPADHPEAIDSKERLNSLK